MFGSITGESFFDVRDFHYNGCSTTPVCAACELVVTDLNHSRLSGYILFPLFFTTIHLGGAWSDWAVAVIPYAVRFPVYTVVPALVVVGTFWRMR